LQPGKEITAGNDGAGDRDVKKMITKEDAIRAGSVSEEDLLSWYGCLLQTFGHQGWWPSDGWFETIVGAILAQNVSWTGAAKAVQSLKKEGLLNPLHLSESTPEVIAPLIYSSRYYNQKAERLLVFIHWFMDRFNGDIMMMQQEETQDLRRQMFSLKGFGPETVDSILLYACGKPVFVVDAYTRRTGSRTGWFSDSASYEEMQAFFTSRIPVDVSLYNDFHAQIVCLGNRICRSKPDCLSCPVREIRGHVYCNRTGIPDTANIVKEDYIERLLRIKND
jgi:endonuclease-3 related protein